jgi:hypothetical protein
MEELKKVLDSCCASYVEIAYDNEVKNKNTIVCLFKNKPVDLIQAFKEFYDTVSNENSSINWQGDSFCKLTLGAQEITIHVAYNLEDYKWRIDYVQFYYSPVIGKMLKHYGIILSRVDGVIMVPQERVDLKIALTKDFDKVLLLVNQGLELPALDTKEQKLEFLSKSNYIALDKLRHPKDTAHKSVHEFAGYINYYCIKQETVDMLTRESIESYFSINKISTLIEEEIARLKESKELKKKFTGREINEFVPEIGKEDIKSSLDAFKASKGESWEAFLRENDLSEILSNFRSFHEIL